MDEGAVAKLTPTKQALYQRHERVGQQLQGFSSLIKVIVPVIDAFYAFDRVIEAAFGHMPGNTERCQ